MKLIKEVLEYIATTDLFGIFPLDVIMHFVLGAIIFYVFLRLFKRLLPAFIGILALALLKEAFDWEIMMRTQLYFEPVKDILVTMVGASICLLPIKNIKNFKITNRSINL